MFPKFHFRVKHFIKWDLYLEKINNKFNKLVLFNHFFKNSIKILHTYCLYKMRYKI